jgi:hypothetical protein
MEALRPLTAESLAAAQGAIDEQWQPVTAAA